MKKIKELFIKTPGYIGWSSAKIAEKLGLKEMTVTRYRKSADYVAMASNYRKTKKND